MTVTGARHAFLGELIDYAGLFPPASLDLASALATYDRDLDGPDAWMLARFIVPVARLEELEPWLQGPFGPERPLRLSVLVGGGDLAATALASFRADLARVEAFTAGRPQVRAEALETRLPVDLVQAGDVDGLASHVADLQDARIRAGLADRAHWLEAPPGAAAEPDGPVLAALARAAVRLGDTRPGYKLRCGGVTRDLVPPVERVAAVLARAAASDVPVKFTAGLHHPVRGMHATEGVPMHGFLNVVGGAVLARGIGLSAAELAPLVAETDPAAFTLDDGGLGWRGRTVPADTVAQLRRDAVGGYGSCSFAEPCEDLRRLALLD